MVQQGLKSGSECSLSASSVTLRDVDRETGPETKTGQTPSSESREQIPSSGSREQAPSSGSREQAPSSGSREQAGRMSGRASRPDIAGITADPRMLSWIIRAAIV